MRNSRGTLSEIMQNTDWIDLVRIIPEDQHNMLVLTTMTGIDLNVELIIRVEASYLVFRGRVSGITDEGRVFFLPFAQIDYMQLNRQVKEAEIRKMYGDETEPEIKEPASGVFAAPSGVFNAVLPSGGSRNGVSISPATPSAPAPAIPTRPSMPGIVARLSTAGTNGRKSNPPAPAVAEAPTPPRNSILERLRAQRNSVVSPKPAGR
jgi:hypothetical protein